jgi:hypothetical protein
VQATCPLLDIIEYQGKSYPLALETEPPVNETIRQWVRGIGHCSAINQGRPIYSLINNQVILRAYRGCAAELSVLAAFPDDSHPVLASWLNGKIPVARGSCYGGWEPATQVFVIEHGKLIEFISHD